MGSKNSRRLQLAPDLSLPLEAVTEKFAILGVSGSGKSHTAAVLQEEMIKAGLQTILLDPTGVGWGLKYASDGKSPGLPVIVLGGSHADGPLEEASGRLVAEFLVESGQHVVLDLSLLRKGARIRFATDFAEGLFEIKAPTSRRTPLHVFMDEGHVFAPQRPDQPQQAKMLGAMEDLILQGRSRGIGVTFTTQRPAKLNKDVLTQCETLIAMRAIGLVDVDTVEAWTSAHRAKGDQETLLESLPRLPTGTGWVCSAKSNLFRQVGFRERETFDSSRTPKVGERISTPKNPAKVDLAALREKMKTVIERAQASDPGVLRKRILDLENKLRQAPASVPAAKAPPPKVVERPVLPEKTAKALERVAQDYKAMSEKVATSLEKLGTEFSGAMMHAQAALAKLTESVHKATVTLPPVTVWTTVTSKPQFGTPILPRPPVPKAVDDGMDKPLSGTPLAMLVALASVHPHRVSMEQFATLSRSRGGGHFNNCFYSIRSRGLVENSPAGVSITNAGLASLDRLPERATLETWRRGLEKRGKAVLRMFDALMEVYPGGLSRDQLAEKCQMHIGGHFNNCFYSLRSSGVMEEESGAASILPKIIEVTQ